MMEVSKGVHGVMPPTFICCFQVPQGDLLALHTGARHLAVQQVRGKRGFLNLQKITIDVKVGMNG